MTNAEATSARLTVSPEVARIVKPGAPRDAQLQAARGALSLSGKDLLTVLFFLCRSPDEEIRQAAAKSLHGLPGADLCAVLKDATLHSHLLALLVRVRTADAGLMRAVITHPSVTGETLLYLAKNADREILEILVADQGRLRAHPDIAEAIIANPNTDSGLKSRLGRSEQAPGADVETGDQDAEPVDAADATDEDENEDGGDEGRSQLELEALMEEADQEGLSKYQISLGLKVAEKIKIGLTGDKEWRALMIKQSNKLVQAAVMKNPRITDGEVLTIAKNKTSSEDLVRMILLNRDWMKNYEIRHALITHPKTPAPKAMRLVPMLTLKDLKTLAKSRQVSTLVATTARKELELRIRKSGG